MAAVAIQRAMGGMVFDAVLQESHSQTLEVTGNPVESGVSVSDHAYLKPAELSIRAGVSDWRFGREGADPFQGDGGRTQKAYEMLLELQATREPFDVQTGLKLYKNMMLTSLSADQTAKTANILVFTASLREVRIVNTRSVKFPPRKAGATTRQAGKVKQKGDVPTTDVTDQIRAQSAAAKAWDAGKKLFGASAGVDIPKEIGSAATAAVSNAELGRGALKNPGAAAKQIVDAIK